MEATGGLSVRDAVVRYGTGATATTAVDGVDLDVADGEILALLGPSGCGKSSLLRAVVGLEPLTAGTVAFAGRDLDGVPVHRRGFGLLFQDGQLFPHRDVSRNVAYGLETARLPRAERGARVRELLDVVGLGSYQRRAVATLSGGERQRVALARALAPRPRLLLLDEPFSALDRALRERLSIEVRDILKATGTTAVFVTHDHDEAFTVADRVGVMSAGRLLQVAPPEELWRSPATRAVADFLGYQAFLPRSAGRSLAIGPTGLRVLPDDAAAALAGGADHMVGADLDGEPTWPAQVVSSAFRRGRTEVTVSVDLGAGTTTLVALVGALDTAYRRGTAVRVGLDRAGCAIVRD